MRFALVKYGPLGRHLTPVRSKRPTGQAGQADILFGRVVFKK